MLVVLTTMMWAVDNRAAEYPPCWREDAVSSHPLFHRDRAEAKTPASEETLRIAFLMGTKRSVAEHVEYLQGAFDNSGVDVVVEVACVSYVDDVPRGTTNAYYYVRDTYSQSVGKRNAADLVAYLAPYFGDGYCGVASVGNGSPWIRTSVTSCPRLSTFAHEIGHNLGLHHAHQDGYDGRKGYCESPSAGAKSCSSGSLLSYAGSNRRQQFADYEVGYGTIEHTAVQWLRHVMPNMVGSYEANALAADAPMGLELLPQCREASHPATESPTLPAVQWLRTATSSVLTRLLPSQ